MQLFLGIDGGQSSTIVLIGEDNGRVIGYSKGGPCNHVSALEASEKFRRVISNCVSEACLAAGVDPASVRFESACCGMSGGPDDKVGLLTEIVAANRLSVKTDGEIALYGAMSGGPGVVVIAGTGSIAYGKNESGQLRRAGGWGYVFGDEGGAFDIARQAIRTSLRFEEGWGPATELRHAFLAATGARNANDLLHLFYTSEWPRARVASLATTVDAVSTGGDAIARGILEQAGQSLASLAVSIQSQLFSDSETVRVAPIGGVFRSLTVHDRFRLLVELGNGSRCVEPDLNAAAGALIEAYRAAGIRVTLSNVPDLK